MGIGDNPQGSGEIAELRAGSLFKDLANRVKAIDREIAVQLPESEEKSYLEKERKIISILAGILDRPSTGYVGSKINLNREDMEEVLRLCKEGAHTESDEHTIVDNVVEFIFERRKK